MRCSPGVTGLAFESCPVQSATDGSRWFLDCRTRQWPAILILGVLASVWRNHRAFVLVGVRPFQRRWGGWECEPGAPGHTAAAKRRWQAGRGTLPLGSRWSPAVVGWLARCVMTVRAWPRGGWPWGGLLTICQGQKSYKKGQLLPVDLARLHQGKNPSHSQNGS